MSQMVLHFKKTDGLMGVDRHAWCCSTSGASLVRQGQPGNYVICVKAEDRVTHVRIRQV